MGVLFIFFKAVIWQTGLVSLPSMIKNWLYIIRISIIIIVCIIISIISYSLFFCCVCVYQSFSKL